MTGSWPLVVAGFRVVHHDRVASTQLEARAAAARGEREVVIVADEQLGGRGRAGRRWESPPGNLYASVVTVPAFGHRFLPACSLIAATALARALDGLAATPLALEVKWPNDVLLGGRKVAGLLLEVADDAVVIGCGLNLARAPRDVAHATTLAEAGLEVTPSQALEHWLVAWAEAAAALAAGDVEAWREAWLARAAGLNRPIRVVLADRTIEGVHRGIDAIGALRVETPAGVETVLAGDVELVRLKEVS